MANIVEEDQASPQEAARAMQLMSHKILSRQAKANEIALKGLYVDWLFDRLQLQRYR